MRESFRFALRSPDIEMVALGVEHTHEDLLRLITGRPSFANWDANRWPESTTCRFWLERSDEVAVGLLNPLVEWARDCMNDTRPRGLLLVRELRVNDETWAEQIVPRVWNHHAHQQLIKTGNWSSVEWEYMPELRIRSALGQGHLEQESAAFEINDEYELFRTTLLHHLMEDRETVLALTSQDSIQSQNMGYWLSIQTSRVDALRKAGRPEEAVELSLRLLKAYDGYAQLWFYFGCALLDLGEFIRAMGAFRRAEKCERFTHVTLYSENSVWEWQSTLGKLFSLIGLGDIEEARSQMKLAFQRVPEVMSQRLTEQLVTSLLQQNEVLTAWDVMEPLLALNPSRAAHLVLAFGEVYLNQEGPIAALKWLVTVSNQYERLLRNYNFCETCYELAVAVNDQHTAHEMLWMMVEFDQVSDTHIDSLVADLLERGRLDEAEKIKHKKSANVDGPAKSPTE